MPLFVLSQRVLGASRDGQGGAAARGCQRPHAAHRMPLMELHPYDKQIGQICYSRTRVRLTLKQDATGKEQQLDLYAWVKVGERDQRTGHAKGTLSPFWRQKFEWDGLRSKLTERPMVIEVCDSDPCDRTSRLLGSPAERPSLGGDDILPFATAYAAAAPPASPDALSMDACGVAGAQQRPGVRARARQGGGAGEGRALAARDAHRRPSRGAKEPRRSLPQCRRIDTRRLLRDGSI